MDKRPAVGTRVRVLSGTWKGIVGVVREEHPRTRRPEHSVRVFSPRNNFALTFPLREVELADQQTVDAE